MARSLGSLTLDLIARIGGFVRGMDAAERKADQTARSIARKQKQRADELEKIWKSVGVTIGTAIGSVITGAGAAAIAVDQLIKAAANFKDLEETTGASAQGLASMAVAAGTAGVSMETVAANSIRLTKALVGVDDESKAAGAAIKALGLDLDEFKRLDPVAQTDALTAAFAGFADGAEKTAVATALWGKTGADMLKVMKALQEQGGRTVILTQQQIELADEYADKQSKATEELKLYAQVAAIQAIPAFFAITEEAKKLIGQLIGLDAETGKLAANNGVKEFAQAGAIAIADLFDWVRRFSAEMTSMAATTRAEAKGIQIAFAVLTSKPGEVGDFFLRSKGPLQELANEYRKLRGDAEEAAKAIKTASQAASSGDALRRRFDLGLTGERMTAFNDPRSTLFGAPQRDLIERPRINFQGAIKDASGKDDPTKKLLENQIKAIEDLVKREQTLLSDRNKFLNLFNDQGLLSIQSYYDAQRAILEAAVSAQTALYQKEIDALKAFQDKKTTSQKDRADAQGKINDLLEKQLQLEQSAGQTGLELSIKQAAQMQAFQREIEGVNVQLLEMQGRFKEAAAIRFDAQNRDIKLRLTIEGKEEVLKQLEEIRKATVSQAEYSQEVTKSSRALDSLAIATERISLEQQKGSITELDALFKIGEERRKSIADLEAIVAAQERIAAASGNEDLILGAQRARLELDKLKASADPLAEKFEDLFGSAFENSFADFLNGTKSAKDAFKDFATSVIQEINRMAAKELAKALFGGLFSSGGDGSSGGVIAGIFGSLFGGARADGGPVEPGKAYVVGEHRPELFVPRTAGTILPSTSSRGDNYNFSIAVSSNGYMDRAAEERAAARIARSVGERARRRSA